MLVPDAVEVDQQFMLVPTQHLAVAPEPMAHRDPTAHAGLGPPCHNCDKFSWGAATGGWLRGGGNATNRSR